MLSCPECKQQTIKLGDHVSRKQGLASLLFLKCDTCEFEYDFYISNHCGKAFDINNRTVYTMRTLGHGYAGIEQFTTLMNMPKPMTEKNYRKTAKKIRDVVEEVGKNTMKDGAEELHEKAKKDYAGDQEVVDVGVSCDGTWQKRGFSSLNGVFVAISMDNGKILDVEALNKHCKACSMKENLSKSNPEAYEKWKSTHSCTLNFTGSSGAMESVGAKRVFERSVETHNLRYIEFLGDGDSKSFLTVKDTYPGVQVKKLECVGHYQKRLGTRLRNLKKKEKGLGGKGKLTDAIIDRLQNFFGLAIRQNVGNLTGMKKSVLASLFHVASSSTNNLHYPHCPTGADSWCKYNVDIANGTNYYKPGKGLPISIVYKIRPTYDSLAKESELEKCLHGKTQNCNESFNNLICKRIPKAEYVSLDCLKFGLYDAVGHFNIGMKSSVLVYEKLNMVPGTYLLKGCRTLNVKRVRRSLYRGKKVNQIKRQSKRAKNLKAGDEINDNETPSYIPGGF